MSKVSTISSQKITAFGQLSIATDDEKLTWYALHVRSNCERAVHNQLEYKGYELYLPTVRVQRRWSDRVKNLDVALFAGYLFCRFDARNPLPVLSVAGVVQIVSAGRTPVPLSDDIICDIQTVQKSGLPYSQLSQVIPGQPVVVDNGPLMGVQGVLVEQRGAHRLAVSISILRRSLIVEIDTSWVRPLSSDSRLSLPESLHQAALLH